jgi:hypothetical protein
VILIVSHPADDHAMEVLVALHRHGHQAVLFDTAEYPIHAFLTQSFQKDQRLYQILVHGERFDLGTCRAAWWRRPQPFTLQPEIAENVVGFTHMECYEAIAGLWPALDVTWVNKPELDEIAHHKPYQLATATRVGLPIPRTVITNDPHEARQFIADLGPERTIYKTFLATEQFWRETRLLCPEEMEILDRVQLAPVIFQEYIPAVADIRVTVIGNKMFATAITVAPGSYEIDYRMDMEGARFEPTVLPTRIARQIRALMKQLGLLYGAVDLRRTPDGRHIFLEVNPAGEWRFIEKRTDQPITEAMARFLMKLDQL